MVDHGVEQRRGQPCVGDVLAGEEARHGIQRRHGFVRDHATRTAQQRAPNFQVRGIERRRRHEGPPGRGIERRVVGVADQAHDAGMRHAHALGFTGGAGREHHAQGGIGRQRRPLGWGCRRCRCKQVSQVENDSSSGSIERPGAGRLHQELRAHDRQHAPNALGRAGQIDRCEHRRTTDGGDHQQNHFATARHAQRQRVARPHAAGAQGAAEPFGLPVQARVAEFTHRVGQCDAIRVQRQAGPKHACEIAADQRGIGLSRHCCGGHHCHQQRTINFAVRAQRHGVENGDLRRQHVCGQNPRQLLAQAARRERRARSRGRHIGAQPLVTGRVGPGHDDGLPYAVAAFERRFDFAQLHTLARHLDLKVEPAQVLDVAVRQPAREVAGLVHAGVRGVIELIGKRVTHKALCSELIAADIAGTDLNAGDAKFARRTNVGGRAPLVENVQACVRDRPADHHVAAGLQSAAVPVAHIDGGFCRAVQVVQANVREAAHELGSQARRQGLAGAQDLPNACQRGCIDVAQEQAQYRRHEVQRGDAFALDQVRQIARVQVPRRFCDDQRGPGTQCREELHRGNIE